MEICCDGENDEVASVLSVSVVMYDLTCYLLVLVEQVICVYGCQQGLGYSWSVLATSYYFKDVMDLSAASAQAYTSATMTPWSSEILHFFFRFHSTGL